MMPIHTPKLKKHCPIATGKIVESKLAPFTPVNYTAIPSDAPSSIIPRIARMINSITGTGIEN